jgi:hypothetical protein
MSPTALAVIWCAIAANAVLSLCLRRGRTLWVALDIYLLTLAMFSLARGFA